MTTIQKLYKISKLKERNEKRIYSFRPTRPDERPIYFNDFQIPTSRSLKYVKERLSKILAFIDSVKQIRFSDGITVMPISCTNSTMLSITGSHMNASNLIKAMKQIGLITIYDEHYQFNAYYGKDNKAKLYAYNYDAEVLLKKYCEENDILKYQISNKKTRKQRKQLDCEVLTFENDTVKFNSKQHLLKPTNWSTTEFEDYLSDVLAENYPQLEVYKRLADELNNKYYQDDAERRISFKEKFTWNKGNKAVRKIGIRATNSTVSAKKEREENDEEWIKYRDDYLNKYNLHYEFDVKSSVPRITYLLNHGVWLDNSIDLYKMIFDEFVTLCPSENVEWNEENRKAFKSLFMRGYFDSKSRITTHVINSIRNKIDYKESEWKDLDFVMKMYKQAIENVLGTLYDSEIFLHESCIYMNVLKVLKESGFDCLQCYDGFYTDKEVINIENIIKQESMKYYATYIINNDKYYNNKDNDINIYKEIINNKIINNKIIINKRINKQENIYNTIVKSLEKYFKQDEIERRKVKEKPKIEIKQEEIKEEIKPKVRETKDTCDYNALRATLAAITGVSL